MSEDATIVRNDEDLSISVRRFDAKKWQVSIHADDIFIGSGEIWTAERPTLHQVRSISIKILIGLVSCAHMTWEGEG